ncbi:MAG: polyprenyl synthetase family protein, partial [Pseudomonadales bacterium]
LIQTMLCADKAARGLVQQAITEKSSEQLPEIVAAVEACGALDFTVQRAEDYAKLARKSLVELPNSAVKTQLDTLSELAVHRNA